MVFLTPIIAEKRGGNTALDLFQTLWQSATNPAILFFLMGLVATLLRVELPIPGGFKAVMTVYLMAAIGFKGGVAVSEVGLGQIWLPGLLLAGLAAVIPLWVFPAALRIGRFTLADAAALAAHYGSVSAVTFATAQNQIARAAIPFEASAPAFLAAMEVPGIITALILYRHLAPEHTGGIGDALRQVLRSKSIFVLLASLIAGYLTGPSGLEATAGFFVAPFQGILTLFLLEMGLEAGRRIAALRKAGPKLLIFATVVPLVNGLIGLMAGRVLGLSTGGVAMVALLAGSASYIAAPTAVRAMIPEANPTLYLTAALGITFPLNMVLGIPFYIFLAHWLTG